MATTPRRPLGLVESAIYACGIFGANVVYAFLNLAAGLYLERYPEVPVWAVGLLSQERSLAGAVVQPIVGAWSDRTRTRIGRRKPFFIGGVTLTAASLLFLAGFPPLIPMLIVLSVNAFFLNVAVDPYYALMADLVPLEQRGRVGALLAVFNMAGQIVATLAGLFLWDRSPELVFVIVAVVLVISFAVTTIFVKEPPPPPVTREPLRLDIGGYVSGLFAQRELVKYVLAAALFWLGTGGVLPYLTRFGVHVLGLSEGEAFQLFLPALGGTIVGAVPAGYLADRRGKKPVLAAGVLAFGLIALVGSQVQDTPQALLAMGVIGLANGFWTALAIPLLIDLVPPERAAEMTGLGSAVWSLAQPIGAVVAGMLIESFDTYRVSFIGAAIFVLLSFALVLTVRPTAVVAHGRPAPAIG
ncbi:MAG TPA: MFS transporter [Candidatus Limnocylindria bacterium]|nr:MFS transporter [Candidatus Limnocylindria bacterium]